LQLFNKRSIDYCGVQIVKIRISKIKYKNINALLMESDQLAVTIIPESGSKIQSIFDKIHQRELLYQSERTEFRKARYASKFENGDFSGFDEVFPSIDECFYPSWPWKGTPIPDHGEVWALPWDYEVKDNLISMHVNGVRFPYSIEKKMEFIKGNCFRMSYEVTNYSNFDFECIWSPHPFFVCDENTMVVLPPSVKQVISTCSLENKLGDYGAIHPWPVTRDPSGERYDISDVLNPKYAGKCEKFYTVNQPPEGWCALHNTRTGETIGLSYPVDKLPYLGVWEGIINDQYITALEPVTGAFDRLDASKLWNKTGVIKAKSTDNWYLNLTIGTISRFNSIDKNGFIISDEQ
jgi:hypothetical protein